MGMVTATKPTTLDEFLAMPETEPPSEFICGEVVQKPMPNPDHGSIAFEIAGLLRDYLRTTDVGRGFIETRHMHQTERRAYLPDVSVVLAENLPDDAHRRHRGPLEKAPDIAIEILSPDDQPSRIAE